jgi:hypothetical protein
MPAGRVANAQGAQGYLLDRRVNNSAVAVNRLLRAGQEIWWVETPQTVNGVSLPRGAFFVSGGQAMASTLEPIARELGVNFHGTSSRPSGEARQMRPVRVGLWDQYGGSMPSGWVRYMLEDFEFDFNLVFPPELDAGNLRAKYDVLIFPDGAIPMEIGNLPPIPAEDIPDADLRSRLGAMSSDVTVPQILEFVRAGGTVVTEGSSTNLAALAGLPVDQHLVTAEGRPLPPEEFFVPPSILSMKVDNTLPVAHGMGETADFMFSGNRLFRLQPGAEAQGIRPIVTVEGTTPLKSGWAWGQEYMAGGVAGFQAPLGQGQMFMFTPRITFRSQPHGTFNLLFNSIFLGSAQPRPIS